MKLHKQVNANTKVNADLQTVSRQNQKEKKEHGKERMKIKEINIIH